MLQEKRSDAPPSGSDHQSSATKCRGACAEHHLRPDRVQKPFQLIIQSLEHRARVIERSLQRLVTKLLVAVAQRFPRPARPLRSAGPRRKLKYAGCHGQVACPVNGYKLGADLTCTQLVVHGKQGLPNDLAFGLEPDQYVGPPSSKTCAGSLQQGADPAFDLTLPAVDTPLHEQLLKYQEPQRFRLGVFRKRGASVLFEQEITLFQGKGLGCHCLLG